MEKTSNLLLQQLVIMTILWDWPKWAKVGMRPWSPDPGRIFTVRLEPKYTIMKPINGMALLIILLHRKFFKYKLEVI